MERVAPMNMLLGVELMYNQWHMVTGLTWGSAKSIMWKDLREEVINVG